MFELPAIPFRTLFLHPTQGGFLDNGDVVQDLWTKSRREIPSGRSLGQIQHTSSEKTPLLVNVVQCRSRTDLDAEQKGRKYVQMVYLK